MREEVNLGQQATQRVLPETPVGVDMVRRKDEGKKSGKKMKMKGTGWENDKVHKMISKRRTKGSVSRAWRPASKSW
jgi:hypothetical protein